MRKMQFPIDLKLELLNYLKYDDLIHAFEYLELSSFKIEEYLKSNNRLFRDFFDEDYFPSKDWSLNAKDWRKLEPNEYLKTFVEFCLEDGLEHFDLYQMLTQNVPTEFDPSEEYLIDEIEEIDRLMWEFFKDSDKYLIGTKAIIRLYSISENHWLKDCVKCSGYFSKEDVEFYYHVVDYALEYNGLFVITRLIEHLFNREELYDVMEYIMKKVPKKTFNKIMRQINNDEYKNFFKPR